MVLTAKQLQLQQITASATTNKELSSILNALSSSNGPYKHTGVLQPSTIAALTNLGYAVLVYDKDSYSIEYGSTPVDEGYLNSLRFTDISDKFQVAEEQRTRTRSIAKAILVLCIVIIILLLLLSSLGFIIYKAKQTGLVAIIDTPSNSLKIPGFDPDAIDTPDDDHVTQLNEKLDMGKMCINMAGQVTLKDAYSKGYLNIINDEINNYPQFVTITLDSNGAVVYQSGLIEVGKSVTYAQLEIALPQGTHECTALFSQVDTKTNKICGQAAAKVRIVVQT